ncbi:hypothetical protein [Clostridium sp. CF012]|uniref:hypothetical protein n=1 Tax=Clostridium sp. CF012 TaxID=2843319 RepID=UPI001C0B9510|nr:hypothetical protein [Clostridium sp. CF012]MBU3145630.1 hypothetical protein [Clostridium sp. CF012]
METRNIKDEEIITQKILSKAQFGKDERAYDKYGGEVLDILVKLFNNLNNAKYKNDGYIEDTREKKAVFA